MRAPPALEAPLISLQSVGLRYGVGPEILRDLSFDIPPKSFQFLTVPADQPEGRLWVLTPAMIFRRLGLSAGSDRQTPERLTNRLWFTDGINNQGAIDPFTAAQMAEALGCRRPKNCSPALPVR